MRGHIRKRGTKWAVVVEIGREPITQKRQQKWHSGYRTRKEAEAALVEIVGRVNRGDYVEPSSQTLTRFLTDWISALDRRGLRESTRQSYSFILEKHVMPRIGDVPLQKLNPSHLNALYTDLLAKGRLDGTGGPRHAPPDTPTPSFEARSQTLSDGNCSIGTPPMQPTRPPPGTPR